MGLLWSFAASFSLGLEMMMIPTPMNLLSHCSNLVIELVKDLSMLSLSLFLPMHYLEDILIQKKSYLSEIQIWLVLLFCVWHLSHRTPWIFISPWIFKPKHTNPIRWHQDAGRTGWVWIWQLKSRIIQQLGVLVGTGHYFIKFTITLPCGFSVDWFS